MRIAIRIQDPASIACGCIEKILFHSAWGWAAHRAELTTVRALGNGEYRHGAAFPEQIAGSVGCRDETMPERHPCRRVRATMEVEKAPQVWRRGSSDASRSLAARYTADEPLARTFGLTAD